MSFDKYNQNYLENSQDKYSPAIAEDLLQGQNEWRNIQDIVRLTFKALTDVVKAQGETLKELELQLPTRASKTELQSALALKANVSDVSRTVQDIANSLDGKISFDDIQTILKEYTLKADMQYLLSSKINIEEVKNIMENRVGTSEVSLELRQINQKVDEIQREVNKKLNNCVQSRELIDVQKQLELKANIAEVNEALDTKANKQSVSTALHRKATKSDIEQLLLKKADFSDLQKLQAQLDKKADMMSIDQKAEKSDFNMLISQLQNKVDKKEMDYYMSLKTQSLDFDKKFYEEQRKIEKIRNEFDDLKFQLNQQINKKLDYSEIEKVVTEINQKVDFDQVKNSLADMKNDIYEDLILLKDDINQFKKNTDEAVDDRQKNGLQMQKLHEQVQMLHQQVQGFAEDRKNDVEETAKFVKNVSQSQKKEIQKEIKLILEDLEQLKRKQEDNNLNKLEKKDFFEIKAQILASAEDKADLQEVQNALNACQADISTRFIEYKEEIRNLMRNLETEVFSQLSKKSNINDINQQLGLKADNSLVQTLVNQKINLDEFEDLRKLIEKVCKEIDTKISFREYEQSFIQLRIKLEEAQKDLLLKANIKDVCTLLDTKSNIEDVNKALIGIHKELDVKSNQAELNNIVSDQAIINESLCTENIVGRWTWKSGELKTGQTIPWEIQVVNTLPDNFLWEKDKTSILIVAPGLYEVTFGFFARKKPTVQLLVNGDPIISAVNTSSYVVHHTSGKLKDIKHPAGTITGLTMIDFIVLPARARISFTYTGDLDSEGFFGLRRL